MNLCEIINLTDVTKKPRNCQSIVSQKLVLQDYPGKEFFIGPPEGKISRLEVPVPCRAYCPRVAYGVPLLQILKHSNMSVSKQDYSILYQKYQEQGLSNISQFCRQTQMI